MKFWRRLSTYLVATLTLFAFIAQSTAQAQTPSSGINLQISPLPIELSTKPGTSTSADLRVRNGGTQNEKLQIRLLKVTEDDNGNVSLLQPRSSDEFVSWVHFSRTIFDAPAGQWQTIKMTIDLPASAAFGYYFAVEYTRATGEPPQPGRAVAKGAVATFILLNADAPGAKREAQVVSFGADRHFYEFLPANFITKIRATGNVHVAPYGNIFIMRGSHKIGTIDINQARGNVLPNSSRFFNASWNDGFPHYEIKTDANGQPILNKNGQPKRSLKWDFGKVNHLRFGHYTAHLLMIYDNGQRDVPLEASVSFWVVPLRLIAAILGLIVLIAGLVTYVIILRRRLKQARGHNKPS